MTKLIKTECHKVKNGVTAMTLTYEKNSFWRKITKKPPILYTETHYTNEGIIWFDEHGRQYGVFEHDYYENVFKAYERRVKMYGEDLA